MKKKSMKIFLTMAMVALLNVSPVLASTEEVLNDILKNTNTIVTPEDLMKNEKFAKEVKEYLIAEVGENYAEVFEHNKNSADSARKIQNLFPVTKTKSNESKVVYPNYIGGLYINEDNDLVIQVVEKQVPNKKSSSYSLYEKIITLDSNAKIEYVNNSYEDLNEIIEMIDNYYSINNVTGITKTVVNGKVEYNNEYNYGNVTAFYIDDINNRVVVELSNFTEEEISKFKREIVDSDIITFVQGEKLANYASVGPGQSIGSCSMGYRAKWAFNPAVGFVTAGHCVKENQNISGVGQVRAWQNSGSIDAAFIVTVSGIDLTNILPIIAVPLPTLSTKELNAVAGESISKVGAASGYKTGKVVSSNWSGTIEGIAHSGMVSTSVYAEGGDSGGIVFGASNYYTAGVISGGPRDGGALIYSNANNINTKFVITRY